MVKFRLKHSSGLTLKTIEGHKVWYPADKVFGYVGFVGGTPFNKVGVGDTLIRLYKNDKEFRIYHLKVIEKDDGRGILYYTVNERGGNEKFAAWDYSFDDFEEYNKI